ncbi:MAG: T9SS type A sorting domain-containing protein [Chitinivibrionales bacterium]|nr:T9SS type A sorting domain-containing protein [Chitinivibrionales bacterium]
MLKGNPVLKRFLRLALFVFCTFIIVGFHKADAAITFDTSSAGSIALDNACEWNHQIGGGSNRILIVSVAGFDPGNPCPTAGNHAVASITYNFKNLTKITHASDCGWNGDVRAEMWYLLDADLPPTGNYEITVNFTGQVSTAQCGAISLAGVDQTGTVPEVADTAFRHTGGFTTFSKSLTTLTDGAWIVDASFPKIGTGSYVAQTPNQVNQIERIELQNSNSGIGISTREIVNAGSAAMGWNTTVSANQLAYVLAAFAPYNAPVPPSNVSIAPSDTSVAVGGTVTFRSTIGTGTQPFSYQWKRGTTVVGSNQSTLQISSAALADSGSYTVTVSNDSGSVTSPVANLTVLQGATITSGPTPVSDTLENGAGANVSFTITATGDNLTYQWRKNGSPVSGTNISGQATATLTISNVTYADSGNYSCRVYNAVSADTSGNATLNVTALIVAPSIRTSPQDQIVEEFQSIIFTVEADGSAPSYQWYHNDSLLSGATGIGYQIGIVDFGDSGYYSVKVWNSKGSDSAAAYLTVKAKPPLVNLQPADTTVAESASASFSCGATGSELRTFTWYKEGQTQSIGSGTGLTTIQLNTIPISSNNTRYRCIVTNAGGADTSNYATLHVTEKVRASFTASPLSGADSVQVVFTNTSTGYIESFVWHWGDGDSLSYVASSPPTQIAHTYRDTGTFTPYLAAIGNALSGRDTAYLADEVEVYDVGDNKLYIDTIRYISSTQIELTIAGLDSLPQGPIPPPPSQMGLWYSQNGRAGIDTALANRYATYEISALETNPVIIVSVEPPSGPADTVYGVWISPLWENGPSFYNTFNTARIKMTPPNNFTIAGSFRGNTGTLSDVQLNVADSLDMAKVTVGKASSELDTNTVEKVIIQYTNNKNQVKATDTIPIGDFRSAISGDSYIWMITDPDFYDASTGRSDTQTVTVSVWQVSYNGLVSDKKTTTFFAGWLPPVNSSKLTVDSTKATKIWLRWDAVSDIDSMRILLAGPPDSITTGRPTGGELSRYDIYYPASVSDNSMTISGLSKETKYYVAMQVQKDLLWSEITSLNLDIAETGKIDPTDIVQNTSVLDSVKFNSTTNEIDVYWTVELNPEVQLDLGVTWSLDAALAITANPDDNDNKVTESLLQSSGTKSGVFNLDLGDSLIFDTTYHIGVWLRSSQGPWAEPADNGIGQVKIPSFTWQSVSYFTSDTITAFNGNIALIKGSYSIDAPIQDSVRFYSPVSVPEGLVPVSVGFSLTKDAFQPFVIGIYFDSIPSGYSVDDLALYRDSAGVLIVQHGFQVDRPNGFVYVVTEKFVDDAGNPMPFIVMVDGAAPVVTFGSDTSAAVDAGNPLGDKISIADNTANVKWEIFYAKDNSDFHQGNSISGFSTGKASDTVMSEIPASFITEETGVRAILIVSDGVHIDTINISRRALRSNSDVIATESMAWVPLSVTADLNDSSAASSLRNLLPDEDWSYNPGNFRLFRWVQHSSNQGNEKKWVEYSDGVSGLFNFIPGRLIWIKTREAMPLGFGAGKSVSLKDTFEMVLPPEEWTDFALPFKFNIAVGDIIASTGSHGDSLQFYSWEKEVISDFNTRTERYYSEAIYIPIIEGLNDQTTEIMSQALVGHTVYNNSGQEIILRIPPVPSTMSRYASAELTKKRESPNGWNICVRATSSSGWPMSPVYCGYSDGQGSVSRGKRPPSFSKTWIGISDTTDSRIYGHAIMHRNRDDVFTYRLAFSNDGDRKEVLSCTLERNGAFPESYETRILNPSTKTWETTENLAVELESGAREYRILAAGTAEALEKYRTSMPSLQLSFVGCYPNPFVKAVRILYTLPYSGIGAMKFEIYDMRGRIVWRNDLARLTPGTGSITWVPQNLAGGIYVLKIQAFDPKGKQAGVFKTRLNYLK